jgi:hypothetical protein
MPITVAGKLTDTFPTYEATQSSDRVTIARDTDVGCSLLLVDGHPIWKLRSTQCGSTSCICVLEPFEDPNPYELTELQMESQKTEAKAAFDTCGASLEFTTAS